MEKQGIVKNIIEIFYPNVCVLCGVVLKNGDKRGICNDCMKEYPYLEDNLCVHCGKPRLDRLKEKCSDCEGHRTYYEVGRSMWVYEDKVRKAIHSLKYKGHKENGELFAKELVRYYSTFQAWEIDQVIPVPLYYKKQRKRGYNQAVLIGEYFAKVYGYSLNCDGLIRTKKTLPQKELKNKARKENMSQAFEAKESVRGKYILLIDDIYTTGATINACSKALKDKGAIAVYYLAIGIGRGL